MKLKMSVILGMCRRENEIEIPDEDLEGLDQIAREKLFAEYLQGHIDNNVDAWWEVIEGD